MDTINHFESETPCYRVAHDGEEVVSVAFGSGKTSTKHQLIAADTWEEITAQLGDLEVSVGEVFIPQTQSEIQ